MTNYNILIYAHKSDVSFWSFASFICYDYDQWISALISANCYINPLLSTRLKHGVYAWQIAEKKTLVNADQVP